MFPGPTRNQFRAKSRRIRAVQSESASLEISSQLSPRKSAQMLLDITQGRKLEVHLALVCGAGFPAKTSFKTRVMKLTDGTIAQSIQYFLAHGMLKEISASPSSIRGFLSILESLSALNAFRGSVHAEMGGKVQETEDEKQTGSGLPHWQGGKRFKCDKFSAGECLPEGII